MVTFEIQKTRLHLLSVNHMCKWGAVEVRGVIGVSVAFVVCQNDVARALSYISHFMGALVLHKDHTENTHKYMVRDTIIFTMNLINNNNKVASIASKSFETDRIHSINYNGIHD